MFTGVVITVLHPPVITTIIKGITISLLRSIRSHVDVDYLRVLLHLLPALLLLLLVLPLRGLPPPAGDLLLQVLVAPRRPLEEMLDTIIDTIIVFSCSEAI